MDSRKLVIGVGVVLCAILLVLVFKVSNLSRKVTKLENTVAVFHGRSEFEKEPVRRKASVPTKDAPRVAIVLDDFGYSKKNLRDIRSLNAPVTLAILPSAPYASAVHKFARENGLETIIHLPLEPKNQTSGLEEDTIMTNMTGAEIREVLNHAHKILPSAVGVNNHMGSKATADERVMTIVLADIKKRNKFFLDSYTVGDSVCEEIAAKMRVPYLKRSIFLDNENDDAYISAQLEKVRKMAIEKGTVVAIGHDRPKTVKMLRKYMPQMESEGIRFVTLAEMVDQKENK